MSDRFGLLELPAQAPLTQTEAVGDPALDMVLAFIQAVLNADVTEAWRARNPADPIPVAYVFNHAPDFETFNANETPAIYMWRNDDPNTSHKMAQDMLVDEAGMSGIWVPPPMPQEHKATRESIRNAIKKSLRAAFAQGRHPAWVLPGDTYYEPEDYGSVLLYHAKMGKCRLTQFKNHTLQIENHDRSVRTSFDCFLFTLDTMETFSSDPIAHAGYSTLNSVRIDTSLADRTPSVEDEGDTV